MAIVKEINHDSSTTLSDFYSSITDTDGAITVAPGAALGSSTNGLEMDYDAGSNDVILSEGYTFSATELRMRFRININTAANSAIGANPLTVELWTTTGAVPLFMLRINATSGDVFRLILEFLEDSGATITAALHTFSATDTCVELRAIRASSAVANDGEVQVFVNGASVFSASDLDNFTDWNDVLDEVRLTFFSGSATLTGILYYDEWILDNDNTAQLCVDADLLTLSIIPKPASIDASSTFIYLALLNNGTPILSKFSTALDADGETVFDPGAGDVIGVECGRFNDQVVWIAGLFAGTDQVEKSIDAGGSFAVKNVGFNNGGVFAFDVGPDSDEKMIVNNNDTQTLETLDDGATWTVRTTTNIEALSIGRLAKNTQETVFGNFGDVDNSINYSINSGADIEDFQTGVFPNENVTGVIVN